MIYDTSNMFDTNEFKKIAIGLLLGVGIVASFGGLIYNARPERAVAALQEEGYTNVNVKGHYLFCHKTETGRNFEATDSTGQAVEGHLCTSILTKRIVATKIKYNEHAIEAVTLQRKTQ